MDLTFAYVSSFSFFAESGSETVGLRVFGVDRKTGALTQVQQVSCPFSAWIEIDPARRFLYACSTDMEGARRIGKVDAYAIEAGAGTLEFLGQVSLGESGPAQLAVSPDGRNLVVANYYYGEYVVVPVGDDGRPGPVSGGLKDSGKGPNPRQDSAHPHAVAFDPAGRFIGAADLGTDEVQVLRLVNGGLELVSQVRVASGMGPRHVVFSPGGGTLYVLGELDGNITVFAYNAETGAIGELLQTISTQPSDFTGVPSGAEIAVHPSGDFLYASNRGSQSVAGYRIDRSTGRLRLLGFATEGVNFPTNFAIDPSGQWLYVNSNMGNEIVQFGIDPLSGELTPTGRTTAVLAPNVMAFGAADGV